MRCIKCDTEIGTPKKYQIIKCQCGAEMMMIEIGGNKTMEPMYREGEGNEDKKYK